MKIPLYNMKLHKRVPRLSPPSSVSISVLGMMVIGILGAVLVAVVVIVSSDDISTGIGTSDSIDNDDISCSDDDDSSDSDVISCSDSDIGFSLFLLW